ncbi:ABC transporter permease [Dactylosporangium fulvum]|uniref:ABC transporter permease n=1 Tax=Dactylosporangium fulvum TaxID=53359 RepID=A0ABY5VZ61_9ACTN|nr:ABC transporter permease [Dactylosporangium fulvum]UWP82401.1 ABC transporter permease [Dactylosporangium fulvum]
MIGTPRSSLLPADIARLAVAGVRARPLRAVLSALGIAIGIAAMLAVVGISASSQQRVNEQLTSLGTNLLRAEPAKNLFGEQTKLPPETVGKVRLVDGVEAASGIAVLPAFHVYRSELIDPSATGGLQVVAADLDLLDVTRSELSAGAWLNPATAAFPSVVLGATAAERLGVVEPGVQVWLGGRSFTVIGILAASPLAPELDTSALIGGPVAARLFGWQGNPSTVYARSAEGAFDRVRSLLPGTVQPQFPSDVSVSRPSDALAAKAAIDQAFTGLLVGLGGIALLVGGIGVANTMIISVIERHREVGLRRALGATRTHIRVQFLAEALVLSAFGGVIGALLGAAVTTVIAPLNDWPIVVPLLAVVVGLASTLVIGAAAGLYPAARAARIPPTTALNG